MRDATLTGRDAVEAIGLTLTLGNRGARFDSRSLSAALRSRIGRARVAAGIHLAVRVPHFHVIRGGATRPALSHARRGRAALEVPARPRPEAT